MTRGRKFWVIIHISTSGGSELTFGSLTSVVFPGPTDLGGKSYSIGLWRWPQWHEFRGSVWVMGGRRKIRKLPQESHGTWAGKSFLFWLVNPPHMFIRFVHLLLLQKPFLLTCLLFRGLHSSGLLGYMPAGPRILSSGARKPASTQKVSTDSGNSTRRLNAVSVFVSSLFHWLSRDHTSHAHSLCIKQRQKEQSWDLEGWNHSPIHATSS